MMTGKDLDQPTFSDAQCAKLFDAILINDRVDAQIILPATININFEDRQLLDCFRISRQLWLIGVDRRELIELTRTLLRAHDFDADDRAKFKNKRAKFKHLRFAYVLYDASHQCPRLLNRVTLTMGQLQDAYKNRQTAILIKKTRLLRLLLSPIPWFVLTRVVSRLQPVSTSDFHNFTLREMGRLQAVLANDSLTGAQFHAARKIVSRQVSFYDDLRTLHPSTEAYQMSRYLSTINGLMGAMHDELVEHRMAGAQNYHSGRFQLSDDLRRHLQALTYRYALTNTHNF